MVIQPNIAHLFHNNRIMIEIRKGMYGLPQADRLAYIKLIDNLQKHGYVRAGLTPGLFKHTTRKTIFSLVVDDFGIKYSSLEDANHLIRSLVQQHYPITINWTGKIFLGINGTTTWAMLTLLSLAMLFVHCYNSYTSFQQPHSIHPSHVHDLIMVPRYNGQK